MRVRRPSAVATLAIWTLFVWVQRINNALNDDELVGTARTLAFAKIVVFVGIGLALGAVALRPPVPLVRRRVVGGAAVFTIAYWVIQIVLIAGRDHAVGFVVVHAVLGGVSGVLAVAAWRSVRSTESEPSAVLTSHD